MQINQINLTVMCAYITLQRNISVQQASFGCERDFISDLLTPKKVGYFDKPRVCAFSRIHHYICQQNVNPKPGAFYPLNPWVTPYDCQQTTLSCLNLFCVH